MAIFTLEKVTFRYPRAAAPALSSVSLDIREGEFLVLCGASGCGKTTLLRLLKRELAPTGERAGSIRYDGRPIEELDPRAAAGEIGFVMQDPESQIVTDKVWHELAFGLENLGLSTPAIRRRVAEMASFFGIADWFRAETASLSGGQKQLLNLAAVMAMQPRVLILDEPTSQLDPIAASEFIETVRRLNRELGLTVIMVEHRLEEVFPVADRVGVLEQGRLLFCVPPAEAGRLVRRVGNAVLAGLPASVRIYNGLEAEGVCPLTVREGRNFLSRCYRNDVRSLERRPEPENKRKRKVLELKDVWFRYEREGEDVLRGVDLSVFEGELLCLLGGNGTGKTTTLNVACGLLKPYRGRVEVNGRKLSAYRGNELFHHNLAMLPQSPQAVFAGKTVREDLEEVGRAMGMTAAEFDRVGGDVVSMLGISHLLDRNPFDLSGGEQQKAALAKVLLVSPRVLLLDEPTKGIDASAKEVLAGILRRLNRSGVTVVAVTHDVEFAAAVADRCALFFDGEVVSVGQPVDFFSGNSFYTTAANRLSRHRYDGAVTAEDVIALCRLNGKIQREPEIGKGEA